MKWALKRNDDGYWYWERGNEESPIFCVRELARKWMRSLKARSASAEGEKND